MYAIKRLARAVLKPSQGIPFHEGHAKQANTIRKAIELQQGTLSKSTTIACDEYAKDILGGQQYAPWLYVYSLVAGGFKEGWIPDNFYEANVLPQIKHAYGRLSSLKPLNTAFFGNVEFPDVGSFVNGLFLDRNYNVISAHDFKDFLFKNHERIVFKVDNSLQGQGIYFFERNNFNIDTVKKLGNGVFQHFINQHPLFNEYASNSVATLRMTTVIDELGQASLRAAYLRFGTGSDTHVKSATHVRIPIDLATGAFNADGYLTSWLTCSEHPTSGRPFAHEKVPSYDKCVSIVKSLHLKVPYVRCVGWDLSVDKEGDVVILEWNAGHNGIKFSEATQGPCFADLGWEKFRNSQ